MLGLGSATGPSSRAESPRTAVPGSPWVPPSGVPSVVRGSGVTCASGRVSVPRGCPEGVCSGSTGSAERSGVAGAWFCHWAADWSHSWGLRGEKRGFGVSAMPDPVLRASPGLGDAGDQAPHPSSSSSLCSNRDLRHRRKGPLLDYNYVWHVACNVWRDHSLP